MHFFLLLLSVKLHLVVFRKIFKITFSLRGIYCLLLCGLLLGLGYVQLVYGQVRSGCIVR